MSPLLRKNDFLLCPRLDDLFLLSRKVRSMTVISSDLYLVVQ